MNNENEPLLNGCETEPDEFGDTLSARTFNFNRDFSDWELDFVNDIESLRLTEHDELFTPEELLSRRDSHRKIGKSLAKPKQVKSSKQNFSFTNYQSREIDRQNLNLLRRIKWAKPVVNTNRENVNSKRSSNAINARKKQQEVDRDNLTLMRKLKTIANRTKKIFS